MTWIVLLAFAAFLFWRGRRAREKAAERAASGQLRSPLYVAANGLVLVLLGLVFFIGHIHRDHGEIPLYLWIAVALIVVALLLLRRALKWRYPYV
jgi:hypothetical protein